MNNIDEILAEIQKKVSLKDLRLKYQGTYYRKNRIRGAIYDCLYRNQPAVLKIVDDERVMLETDAHLDFLNHNTSRLLQAPGIFQSEQLSPTSNWILMEKIPEGQVFDLQYIEKNREEFLKCYLEYRRNFPEKPSRPLTMAEYLPAQYFHTMRLSRWADLGNTQEYLDFLTSKKRLVDPKKLGKLFSRSMKIITRTFRGRPLIWSKGNFWPNHLIKTGPEQYYLLDFSLTKMYPQGYELGGMLWSCHLMWIEHYTAPWDQWLSEVNSWRRDLINLAHQLQYPEPEELILGCILERIWGTIYADILASDKSPETKSTMLDYLTRLVEELLKTHQS
jgi:hypothetical protein